MLLALLATVFLAPQAAADTSVTFGIVQRDLTGDGVPELLTLKGTGSTVDTLEVTFTIQSSGRLLYDRTWQLTRSSFDPRRRITDAELRARLGEFGNEFFAEAKFMSPQVFLSWLQASARLHIPLVPEVIARDMTPNDVPRARMIWKEMQAASITLFQFSPGGDRIRVIGWSATDDRFYDLLECC